MKKMKKLVSLILAAGVVMSSGIVSVKAAVEKDFDSIKGWSVEYSYDTSDQYWPNPNAMSARLTTKDENTYNNADKVVATKSSGKHSLRLGHTDLGTGRDGTHWVKASTTVPASKLKANTKYQVSFWESSAFAHQNSITLTGGINESLLVVNSNGYWDGHRGPRVDKYTVSTGETVSDTMLNFILYRGKTENTYTGQIYIDDVSFVELDSDGNAIGENLVVNGGFEDDAISNFKAMSSGTDALLTWDEDGHVSNVYIYEKNGDEYTQIAKIDGGIKQYTVPNLTDGQTYTFAIKYDNYSNALNKSTLLVSESDDYQTTTLAVNSSFEEELSDWKFKYKTSADDKAARFALSSETNGGEKKDIIKVHNGEKALELYNTVYSEDYVSASTEIAADKLAPNTEYTLSFYKANAGNAPYELSVSGAANAVLKSETIEADNQYAQEADTYTFTTGEDVTAGLTIEFKLNPSEDLEAYLWIDDVTLTAQGGDNLITNGDFERTLLSDFSASPICSGSTLSWAENVTPTNVYVAKKVDGSWVEVGSVAGGVRTYTVTNLANAQTHTLGIKYEFISKFAKDANNGDKPIAIDGAADYIEATSIFNYPEKNLDGWTSRFVYQNASLGAKMASGKTGVNANFAEWANEPTYNTETGKNAVYLQYGHGDSTDYTHNELAKSIPAANLKPNTTYELKYWYRGVVSPLYDIEISGAANAHVFKSLQDYVKGTDTLTFTTNDSIYADLRIAFRQIRGSVWPGWIFLDDIAVYEKNGEETVGENLVPNGDFEDNATIELLKVGEATVKITNGQYTLATENVYGTGSITAIIAIYDKATGALAQVQSYERPKEYKKDVITINGLDGNTEYYAKAMVWDSLTGMIPQARSYTIGQ